MRLLAPDDSLSRRSIFTNIFRYAAVPFALQPNGGTTPLLYLSTKGGCVNTAAHLSEMREYRVCSAIELGLQIVINAVRSSASGRHGGDNQVRPGNAVAASEHTGA